jgi:hypothetical protein
MDNICRILDGATSEQWSLYKLMKAIDLLAFYDIYQPNRPNDVALFRLWEDKLLGTGLVEIRKSSTLDEIIINKMNAVEALSISGKIMRAKEYILAITPHSLLMLLDKAGSNRNMFGEYKIFRDWVRRTEYLTYISITCHWSIKIPELTEWGMTMSPWAVGFITLSNYMNFDDTRSTTVMSTSIMRPDDLSPVLRKTANQCNESELKGELLRQLRTTLYPKLPDPDTMILNNYYDSTTKRWLSHDISYVNVIKATNYLDMKSPQCDNLWTVGVHTGGDHTGFTTMEAAINNGITLVNRLLEGSQQVKIPIRSPKLLLSTILYLIFGIIAVLIFYRYRIYNR